jgi:hypothetical protein
MLHITESENDPARLRTCHAFLFAAEFLGPLLACMHIIFFRELTLGANNDRNNESVDTNHTSHNHRNDSCADTIESAREGPIEPVTATKGLFWEHFTHTS